MINNRKIEIEDGPILLSYKVSFFLLVISLICNIISFVTPFWIVSIEDNNLGFVKLGLWEVCFDGFVFSEDYVSKAYYGCWYIYYPEYRYIRFWLNPRCCFIVNVLLVGLYSKDREWLPRADHNRVSWSFALAVFSGFFNVLSVMSLITNYVSWKSKKIYRKFYAGNQYTSKGSTLYGNKPGSGKTGIESKLNVPSLFMSNMQTGSGFGPSSYMTGYPQGNSSIPGIAEQGKMSNYATSGATVSAKLREALESQKNIAAKSGLPPIDENQFKGSMHSLHQSPPSNYGTTNNMNITMDTTV